MSSMHINDDGDDDEGLVCFLYGFSCVNPSNPLTPFLLCTSTL